MAAFAGTHCILQVGTNQHTPSASLSSYNGSRNQILGAVDVDCFVLFGLRLGWDHIETGRVKLTGSAALNSTTLSVSGDHPALSSGTVLSFATSAAATPVEVTLSSAAAANSTTISVVGSHAAISSGARAGVYDDRAMNACFDDIVVDRGLMFAPRIMNGKYTPTNLITDGSPIHAVSGGTATVAGFPNGGVYHEPYNSSGVTNPILLLAGVQLYRHVFAWADAKQVSYPGSVPLMNIGTFPGMDYAELWFGGSGQGGDYIAALHGASQTTNKNRMVSSNSDWMDALVTLSAGRYPLAFGISGLGGLSDIIAPGIAAHAATYGAFNELVFVNANGWAPNGEWGTDASNEAVFDNNVWSKSVQRGVQDIVPSSPRTAANWTSMFQTHAIGLPTRGAIWTEIYAFQVRNGSGTGIGNSGMNSNQAAWDEMVSQSNAFNALVSSGPQTVTLPLIDRSAVAHAPAISGQFVTLPRIDRSAFVFTPEQVTASVSLDLLDQTPVITAPQVGVGQQVTLGLLDNTAQIHTPQILHETIETPLISNAPQLHIPAVTQQVDLPLIDQSATAQTPVVNNGPSAVVLPLIDRSAQVHAPRVDQQVDLGLIDQSAVATAPSPGLSIGLGLIDQSATAQTPSAVKQQVGLPLIDRSAAAIAPAVDDGTSPLVSIGLIDRSPVLHALSIVQDVPVVIELRGRYMPTIRKRGQYTTTTQRRLRGRYQRTIRKRGRDEEMA